MTVKNLRKIVAICLAFVMVFTVVAPIHSDILNGCEVSRMLNVEILYQRLADCGRVEVEISRINETYFYFNNDGTHVISLDYNLLNDSLNVFHRDLATDVIRYDTLSLSEIVDNRTFCAYETFQEFSTLPNLEVILANESHFSNYLDEATDVFEPFASFQPFSQSRNQLITNRLRGLVRYNLDGARDLGAFWQNGMRAVVWQERVTFSSANMPSIAIAIGTLIGTIAGLAVKPVSVVVVLFSSFVGALVGDQIGQIGAIRQFSLPRTRVSLTLTRTVAVDGGNGTITNWGQQYLQYDFTFGLSPTGAYTEPLERLISQHETRYWNVPSQMGLQGISNWFSGHRP